MFAFNSSELLPGATGKGKDQPLLSNESDAGRQQNRRVELIIDNLPAASAASIR